MNEDMDIDNYKLAVISNAEHYELEDGEFVKFGSFMFYIYHRFAMRDFCKKYYKEILNYPDIHNDSPPELYAYYLQEQGNIVISNLTHASKIDEYGKEAVIFMPQKITEKQKESLEVFMEKIEDYELFILYDFHLENGLPQSKNIIKGPTERPIDLLNRYYDLTTPTRKNSLSYLHG